MAISVALPALCHTTISLFVQRLKPQASQEIEESVKQGGEYTKIFVVHLRAGRVKGLHEGLGLLRKSFQIVERSMT